MIKLTITKDEKSLTTYNNDIKNEIIFSTEIPDTVLYKLIGNIAKTVDDALGLRAIKE